MRPRPRSAGVRPAARGHRGPGGPRHAAASSSPSSELQLRLLDPPLAFTKFFVTKVEVQAGAIPRVDGDLPISGQAVRRPAARARAAPVRPTPPRRPARARHGEVVREHARRRAWSSTAVASQCASSASAPTLVPLLWWPNSRDDLVTPLHGGRRYAPPTPGSSDGPRLAWPGGRATPLRHGARPARCLPGLSVSPAPAARARPPWRRPGKYSRPTVGRPLRSLLPNAVTACCVTSVAVAGLRPRRARHPAPSRSESKKQVLAPPLRARRHAIGSGSALRPTPPSVSRLHHPTRSAGSPLAVHPAHLHVRPPAEAAGQGLGATRDQVRPTTCAWAASTRATETQVFYERLASPSSPPAGGPLLRQATRVRDLKDHLLGEVLSRPTRIAPRSGYPWSTCLLVEHHLLDERRCRGTPRSWHLWLRPSSSSPRQAQHLLGASPTRIANSRWTLVPLEEQHPADQVVASFISSIDRS